MLPLFFFRLGGRCGSPAVDPPPASDAAPTVRVSEVLDMLATEEELQITFLISSKKKEN